jgi:Retrotransposon gag protein
MSDFPMENSSQTDTPTSNSNTSTDAQQFLLNSLAQISTYFQGITVSQRQLYDSMNTLATHFPNAQSASAPHAPAIKFKEPPMFKGKPDEVDGFLYAIQDGIIIQHDAFTSDEERVTYMGGYLAEGVPKAWLTGVRKHSPNLLKDFDAFVGTFKLHFGDPDFKGTALRKLRALNQTGSCAQYAARFRELVVALDLSEFTLCEDFYTGLKSDVKDAISLVGKPTTLDALERKAIELDNHLFARRVEKSHEKGKTSDSTTKSSKPPPTPHQQSHPPQAILPTTSPTIDDVPMEVDVARRGPLSAEEKQRRRLNNLCLYCGGVGHLANVCPKIPASNRRSKPCDTAGSPKSGKAKSEAH